jgi:hypothetical protein
MLIALLVLGTFWLLTIIWAVRSFRRASREPARPRVEARVTTLENVTDDLDKRVEYLASEVKSIRGRQYASEKRSKDDVPPTNGEESSAEQQQPPARSYLPTAHLSRRFRGF